MELDRVLYPIDLSQTPHHGLQTAAEIARRSGAELVLAHVIDFPYPYLAPGSVAFDVESYYEEAQELAEQRLAAIRHDLGESVRVRSLIARGNAALGIVDLAAAEQIDLVVMPTHARKGLDRLLVGSVTEKVVRLCGCPVLTIAPGTEAAAPATVRKILFPTDFSDPSDQALGTAVSVAELFDAEILMLHVVTVSDEDPSNPEWSFPSIPREHVEAVENVARGELEQRGEQTPDAVRVDTRLARGFDAASVIDRVAKEEAVDLIVMATHGHTGLVHALLGSTAGKVIRRAPCPVLTVRSH